MIWQMIYRLSSKLYRLLAAKARADVLDREIVGSSGRQGTRTWCLPETCMHCLRVRTREKEKLSVVRRARTCYLAC